MVSVRPLLWSSVALLEAACCMLVTGRGQQGQLCEVKLLWNQHGIVKQHGMV
jgi:hypothetical protein